MTDEQYMMQALKQAQKSAAAGEIPVGCVIVKDGVIVSRAGNSTEKDNDPTSHAELKAIKKACKKLGSQRLTGCTMYVTLEPCSMCAGAIVLARIKTLHIACMDPKSGACGSLRNIACDDRLNHRVEIRTGLLKNECERELKAFFKKLRSEKKKDRIGGIQ